MQKEEVNEIPNPENFKNDNSFKPKPIRIHKVVKRNDPCPCGSGEKFKNCCMNKENGNDNDNDKTQN